MKKRDAEGTAGFTLLEVLVSVGLVGIIVVNLALVLGSGSSNFESTNAVMATEVQARRAMDRIELALMGSSRDSLFLAPVAPEHTEALNYEMNLGVQDGEPVYSDPQRIELVLENGQVRWIENPEAEGSISAVWAKWISEYLEGEVPNGIDDNGNGLIDERGLSFNIDGNSVIIRLTMSQPGPDDGLVTRTLERRVTCRN